MMETKKRAVVYARVSDKKQAEAEVSIPAQIEAATRRAAALGAHIERVFKDEGRSAFKAGNRPAFEAAVDYATTVQVDYFITWSSARFARNRFEAIMYKGQLDRAGVGLVYLDMEVDRTTDAGWMMDGVLELFDEMKSRQTAVDTKRSLLRNAEQGYYCGGPPPYGFTSVPAPDNAKRRKLAQVPEEADNVRRVFEFSKGGMGGKMIAAKLNSMGLLYRGRPWKKDNVLHLLRNQSVIGKTVFNRFDRRAGGERPQDEWIVVDSHPPIIDADTWHAVQESLDYTASTKELRATTLSSHPFTGLLRCATCGGALTSENATGRHGGRYAYYVCRRGRQDHTCERLRWPATALDAHLTEVIFQRILVRDSLGDMAKTLTETASEWYADQRRRRQALQTQLADVKRRNKKLYEVLEEMGRGAPNLADLTERLQENNAAAKALETQILALDAEEAPALALEEPALDDLASDMRSIFTESTSLNRLKAFYRGFIDQIVVKGDSVEIHYSPGAIVATAETGVHRLRKWGAVSATPRTHKLPVILPYAAMATSLRRSSRRQAAGSR